MQWSIDRITIVGKLKKKRELNALFLLFYFEILSGAKNLFSYLDNIGNYFRRKNRGVGLGQTLVAVRKHKKKDCFFHMVDL